MKTFEVFLTKSYVIKIEAENINKAKDLSELFTGNIQDISTPEDRKRFKFEIKNIDCKVNEAFKCKEIQ